MAGITSAIAVCIVAVLCTLLTVEGCVPLDPGCQQPSTTPAITFFGDINSPVVIIAIVVGCIAAVVIILLLLWLCCWCWYRTTENTDDVPAVIRRTIIVREKKPPVKQMVQRPVKKIEVNVAPRPPPVIQHPPSEKIVVVQPVATQPASLLLTVSDGNHATDNGPMMTANVDQPLKFTLTPEYVGQRATTDLSVYEHNCQSSAATSCSCSHH